MDKSGNQGKGSRIHLHPFFKKFLKATGWIFGILFLIIALVVIALQFPQTQTFLTKKAISFLENKIQTKVELGGINIAFPKSIWLQDIYLEDQKQDTLLYCHSLQVDVDLMALLDNEIQVNDIEIEKLNSHVYRTLPDSAFNFDYIIAAFADTTTVEEDTTSSPWKIHLYGLEIQNTRLQYDDEVNGLNAALNLGKFHVDLDEFDLDSMRFKINEILLENTVASYKVTKASVPASTPQDTITAETSPFIDIDLNEVNLSKLNLMYDDQVSGQKAVVNLGSSNLTAKEINLAEQKIKLKNFDLNNTSIAFTQAANGQSADTIATLPATDSVSAPISLDFGWIVGIDKIDLNNNNLKYDDFNQPRLENGMDFSHLWASNFTLKLNDIELDKVSAQAIIEQFTFKEHSGFRLENLAGKLAVNETKASLSDFNLKTGYSEMKAEIASQYNSLDDVQNNLPSVQINAEIPESRLAYQDLLYFQPNLADSLPLTIDNNFILLFNSKVKGTLGDLDLENLKLSMLNQTVLTASGHITGLPDTEHAGFNVHSNFRTTKSDLNRILPDTLIPASIKIPENIDFRADLKGSMADLITDARLQTSYGTIATNVHLLEVQSDNPSYNGKLTVEKFDLGALLNNPDTIGIVDLSLNADGTGFTPETINTKLEGIVNIFEYQQYTYNNLQIDGTIDQQHFTGKANMDDENLAFNFNGDVNMNKEIPEYKFVFDLKKAYLQKLMLSSDDLRLKTKIDADLKFANIDEVNGSFGIRELAVFKNGELYNVDSFLVASVSQQRNTSLKINSDILSAEFKGNIGFGTLPATLNQHFNSYYSLHDSTVTKNTEAQNFSFVIDLKETELLTKVLLPALGEFNPGVIKGEYNSEAKKLAVNMEVPVIQYAGFNMDSLALNIDSDPQKLTYEFKIAQVRDSTYRIDNFSIDGKVQNDSISTQLLVLDSVYKVKFRLAGIFYSQEQNYKFRFLPHGVLLNYMSWNLPSDHYLQFGNNGFSTNHFLMSHEQQQIDLTAKDKKLNVNFKQFELGSLSAMIEASENIVRGIMNGSLQLDNQQEAMAFKTDLNIKDFSFMEDTLGNLALKASNPQSNRYNVALNISGFGNDAQINGYYLSDSLNPAIDFNIDLNKLNLASIQSFTAGQLDKAAGFISGDLSMTGSPTKPDLEGALQFNQAKFEVSYLKTVIAADNQAVNFNRNQVNFNNFTVTDPNNQNLVIDGMVDISDFTNPGLDLNITSDNFLVMNTTEKDNDMYFGKLLLSSKIDVTGNATKPEISMNISIGDKSSLTYIVPESETGSTEQEGIVRFVDKDKASDEFFADIENQKPGDTLKSSLGMDLNANIIVTKGSQFKVVIDPTSGDQLAIRGDANLSMEINPAGDISLTGRYEVDEGQYNLSFYSVVKRQFSVKQGSSLVWSGDILNAQVDLTAVYKLETAPIELMQARITDNSELNIYKQELPFLVNLNMKGELLKPVITFSMDMPEDSRNYAGGNVYSTIQGLNQEESQLNKQVFALLVLKRFIAENPFASSGGSTEGAVRSSVSKILSDQLSKLTDQVKGIDIDVGLKSSEDYSSGQAEGRTDLNLGLSKQFLNDRITVKVAGNINLEGSNQQQQKNLSDFAGDISIEYKLTEDGRFRLVTFRKEVYEQLLEGEVIETGAGFIIVKDYDKFREIFKKNKEENWKKTNDSISKQ